MPCFDQYTVSGFSVASQFLNQLLARPKKLGKPIELKTIRGITLIGGPAGWRAMFPNEKNKLSAGCTEKTKGWASGLQKRTVLRPALFRSSAFLLCSPLAHPVVQPAGPSFCAARQPAENSSLSFSNTPLQPAGPPFSVI